MTVTTTRVELVVLSVGVAVVVTGGRELLETFVVLADVFVVDLAVG